MLYKGMKIINTNSYSQGKGTSVTLLYCYTIINYSFFIQ
ncbi:hypothetical protein SAMN04488505_103307 [Chitinophaga rupis]|uniref:Uncharacterized protein n=1 Tax=Chitinophaga rupis TaxID=573321 RepID=A0A1H7VEG2_9BACT|nr:hypothetical protein SAMN04488505_103307 [Chitinophaga rupis]